MTKILILDFGAQYTQLIARRVREAEGLLRDPSLRRLATTSSATSAPQGIILSGSHISAYEERPARAPQAVFELGVPVLGICYGMQTMAQQLGGEVEAGKVREFGYAEVRARGHTQAARRHRGLPHRRRPRHAQGVDEPRRQGRRAAAGLQADGLHRGLPDRRHGRRGAPLLRACSSTPRSRTRGRARRCCTASCATSAAAAATGTCRNTSARRWRRIREQVGSDEVILGLSGGVDSSVAAALIHKAIGEQLTCVFVDHGLLRLDEGEAGDGHLRRSTCA